MMSTIQVEVYNKDEKADEALLLPRNLSVHSSNKITRYNNNNNNNNIIISHHVFRILFIPRNFIQSISNFVQLLNISIKKKMSRFIPRIITNLQITLSLVYQ